MLIPQRRNRVVVAAAVVLAVLVAAGLAVQRKPTLERVVLRDASPVAVATELASSSDTPPTAIPASGANLKGPADAQRNLLLDGYNAGTQMRELLAHAVRHPEQGGHFYAAKFLTFCGGIANLPGVFNGTEPAPDIAGDPQRLAAASAIQRRCSEFVESEYSNARVDDLRRTGRSSGDPLFKAVTSFRLDDPVARAEAVARILSTKDPVLFDDVGARLAIGRKSDRIVVRFDGVDYFLRDHPQILHVFYLLPCGLGLDCNANEPQTALRCAAAGDCFASRFDAVKHQTATTPGSYDEVMRLYEAMVASVKAGNHEPWIR